MLTFNQIKAIEHALGADKAGPVIQAFESVKQFGAEWAREELVTRDYLDVRLAEARAHLDTRLAELKAETIKWVAGMLIAQAAVVATLVKLL